VSGGRVGLITGSGAYEWPDLAGVPAVPVTTAWGTVEVTEGQVAGVDVVHLSRHGAGHARLSNHVDHRANLRALLDLGVDRLLSLTVCGSLDPAVPAGSVVVPEDLYFPANRLPDGSLCTWYAEPGAAGRGHWVPDEVFSEPLRRALCDAAAAAGTPAAGGCYGHVDGPRFNTRAEHAALTAAGVTAVSQTAGPEVVLAGEAELPVALLCYITNGIEPEPDGMLLQRVAASRDVLAAVVVGALPHLGAPRAGGVVHRFG
jgi:5'-methylthioadenosine phosphorylase